MIEFEFKVQETEQENSESKKIIEDTYVQSQYHALSVAKQNSTQIQALQTTQILLKTQTLLLEYEQKRKNQKLKQIEYVYTNSFNNYLWEKHRKKGASPLLIMNRKDILQIDEQLPEEMQAFRKHLLSMKMDEIFTINSKPNPIFLRDFYNFFGDWKRHISTIIKMQIDNSPQIQNAFESQYTFPAKVLSSLKFSSNIEIFCSEIFRKPLKEIVGSNEELSLDFNHIYEPLLAKISSCVDKGPFNTVAKFINRTDGEVKNMKKLKEQISQLIGTKPIESEKLIGQMSHFSLNKQAISYLFSEIGSEQIDESSVNVKLAVLVWKKILQNRRKIQSILISFIDQILKSYYTIPQEVKFIMREYYRLAKCKYGQVKYEDVKAFFNKVIYSQLLLPQFMRMLEEQNGVSSNVKNFNIPIIALFSQKILYGQQFYDKQKYTYFNQLITYYSKPIQQFMRNFIEDIKERPSIKKQRIIYPILLSLESIKYLYETMRNAKFIEELPGIYNRVCQQKQFQIGSTKFKSKDVYLILVNKVQMSYQQILKPKDKIKRIFIQFLTLIDKIPHSSTFQMLLQQYKYTTSKVDNSSVEIHANYLSLARKEFSLIGLCEEISKDIANIKQECQKVKIELEKQYNLAQNMEKVYMKKLQQKQKFNATISIKQFIDILMEAPAGFHYQVVGGKVCEVEEATTFNSLSKCMSDIAEYYAQNFEGCDALYHLVMEKVNEEVESHGVVYQETLTSAREIIGAKLYQTLKLNSSYSEKDKVIYNQMQKHKFINLKLLQLPQYLDEEDLILQQTLPILERLKTPQSANELLNIFYQATLVFQNIILITGKASDITADIQIPMMILIFIKSQIRNLSSLIKYIEKFASDDINSSVLGQTLTLINSATYLIEQMGAKQLNLSNQQYERLCAEQFERTKAQIDRQYMIINSQ